MLEIHGHITTRFRQGIKSAFADLDEHGKSGETWNQFAERLVDTICVGMNESKFAAPEG